MKIFPLNSLEGALEHWGVKPVVWGVKPKLIQFYL